MCEFESNILKLLLEEKTRVKTIFTDKDAPYMRSLDQGIKSAEKKLEECEYKECVKNLYKQNPGVMPVIGLQHWATLQLGVHQCKK
jgi:hypothetical protein